MKASKLQLKLYFADAGALPLEAFVPLFHDWIKTEAIDEVLVDVSEYGHAHESPVAVLLTGHGSEYAIDLSEGRPGLAYRRKRAAPEGVADRFDDAWFRILTAAQKLELAPDFTPPLRVRTDEVLLRIADRLNAPNTELTRAEVEPHLRQALSRWFGDQDFSVEPVGGPKEMFSLRIRIPDAPSVTALLNRRGLAAA